MQADQPAGANVGVCVNHHTERAVGQCDDCGGLWCDDCIVPPARKRQPTRCIGCALIAAGVRAPGPRGKVMDDLGRQKKRPTNLF